ncbi:branched-chain amino acid transport system II carrier protein [Actinomyces viscosus]|uniref:LIV-II n=1 Tax=Actinomyces viscosus TaxID=1656 RepID=A0A3S4VI10_ACTVI|nr:branched-chain amino acid transport system II carrier protein [Actinomyces viscosus]TFH53527.1 branched-chain amino acid transport system II carrier protein [Actinomyces viscosus]VEI14515.1 LIV-II [Actinomyces viscosus]
MTQLSNRSAVGTILPTGLMLFALFFGAGNLIFPPLLGAASGKSFIPVMAGFLATGVLMPLITVVAVSTSGEGILGLARRVGPRFGLVMPLAVYLAIGPLYAIARVTTVAYELATRPVLELWGMHGSRLALLVHVTVFMAVAFGIARSPSRLADRVGRWLTPALLALLCGVTVLAAPGVERQAIEPYASAPLTTGLTQGYLTMDVLAATVFGIVVITSLRERGLTSPKRLVRGTILSGGIAAALLGLVYIGLAVLGTRTRGEITTDTKDGTELLRNAASSTLGTSGVVIFAAIVILACLTTAVGLLASWAGYAYTAWPAISFNRQLAACALVSFTLANLGLSAILKIAGPLLYLLHPFAIALVTVTLVDALAPGRLRAAYQWCVITAGIFGSVSAITAAGWDGPSRLLARTGLWSDSTGWILPALIALGIGIALDVRSGAWSTPAPEEPSQAQHDVEHAAASQL